MWIYYCHNINISQFLTGTRLFRIHIKITGGVKSNIIPCIYPVKSNQFDAVEHFYQAQNVLHFVTLGELISRRSLWSIDLFYSRRMNELIEFCKNKVGQEKGLEKSYDFFSYNGKWVFILTILFFKVTTRLNTKLNIRLIEFYSVVLIQSYDVIYISDYAERKIANTCGNVQ